MTEHTSIHGQWSNRLMFVLAATGSAVGLGNIWKFPYITGENGGGAFVAVYLACIAIVGVPIMMAEIMIGRRGRQSPINTMRTLARDEKAGRAWVLLGWGGTPGSRPTTPRPRPRTPGRTRPGGRGRCGTRHPGRGPL